ncbi:MAG: fibronectin type III domain-containing protein [Syntrophobacteraceae bacterium]
MANKRITDFTEITSLADNDELIVFQKATNTTKKIKKSNAAVQGEPGVDGADSFIYIAYASNASGTGFTTTFNASLDYIAILATDTELTPQASHFTGLWKNYKGEQGEQGLPGESGLPGADGSSLAVGDLTEKLTIHPNDLVVIFDSEDGYALKMAKYYALQQVHYAASAEEETQIYTDHPDIPSIVTRTDIIGDSIFTIADATSASSAENIALALAVGTFVVASADSASSAENILLALAGGTLAVADADSLSTVDNIDLEYEGGTLAVADAGSTSSADNITLEFGGAELVVADAASDSSADNVVLSSSGEFDVADAVSASSCESPTLEIASGVLSVADASSLSTADNITLEFGGAELVVADASSTSSADNILLEQASGTFAVADATSASSADNVVLVEELPDAPVISSIDSADSQLTAHWSDVTGETSYTLYYSTSASLTGSTYDGTNAYPGTPDATAGKITGISAGSTSQVISSLTKGTGYYIRLSASNGLGESDLSSFEFAFAIALTASENFESGTDGNTLGGSWVAQGTPGGYVYDDDTSGIPQGSMCGVITAGASNNQGAKIAIDKLSSDTSYVEFWLKMNDTTKYCGVIFQGVGSVSLTNAFYLRLNNASGPQLTYHNGSSYVQIGSYTWDTSWQQYRIEFDFTNHTSDVYRRASSGDSWTKLNSSPLTFGNTTANSIEDILFSMGIGAVASVDEIVTANS